MFCGGIKIAREKYYLGMVEHVFLIGGGDFMLYAAQRFLKLKFTVSLVLSQRHADEYLPIAKNVAIDAFKKLNVSISILDTIKSYPAYPTLKGFKKKTLALCFGPAWIFPESFIKSFEFGMLNFNGIPVPKYLGGAHYSWQILNKDRSGGCVLQVITQKIDRGPIIRAHYFDHSPDVRTPQDYFISNYNEGCLFIENFIDDIKQNRPFRGTEYNQLEHSRLFFPRLFSDRNGWINWSWKAEYIERFCCAFDTPYLGAATIYGGNEVRLGAVFLETNEGKLFHPFCAGLVLRKWKAQIWVGAQAGILRVERVFSSGGDNLIPFIKEGYRFYTPNEKIEDSITYMPQYTGVGIKT